MSAKDKPPDFMKAVKVPIKHIIKNPDITVPKVTDAVVRTNKIIIHTLQFMKLYLLDFYDKNKSLPVIDKVFVNSCMKILCNDKTTGRPPKKEVADMKAKLTKFYEVHYKPLTQKEELDYTYLNTVLDYATIDIQTMYENNIKVHFVEYIERYVNVVWKKKMLIEKVRKLKKSKKERDAGIYSLCKDLRTIKTDILTGELKSKKFYHKWITEQRKHILPNKTKFDKDSIYYDLKSNSLDYFPSMVYMMKQVESEELSIYNVFPLRREIIPKHMRIDTTTLVHLLFTKKQGNKSYYLTKGNLKRFEDKIWEFFFRTERQCFKKRWYKFHNMIETDGTSVSILFKRNDLVGKRIPQNKQKEQEKYITDLEDTSHLQNKKVIGIDPGLNSLIYCVDGDTKEANTFGYTQNQRRKETKSKKFNMIVENLKKYKIEGKTIIEYETELSQYNRKTLVVKKFKEYVKKKNEINTKLFGFYEQHIFRKLKLNGYLNRLKSEQRMMNDFMKILGAPKEAVVCIGDFEQKKHRKFKEPTKGVGFRKLLRKNGYEVYLIDEFRTSCRCSKCQGGICENFLWIKNPKPNQDNLIKSHTLLRCKNGCGVWNRDCNGATNIRRIGYNAIHKVERPSYLCRSS